MESLFDCEFAIESQFLRHITDSWTGNAALLSARLTTKDVNFSTVETATADDAAEQRRLAATARSQQSVTERWNNNENTNYSYLGGKQFPLSRIFF